MFKKVLFLLILTSTTFIWAQNPGRRWAELYESENKTIYIDTTSIRAIDNQLSVWSLLIYERPVEKDNIEQKVKKIKTQYLINSLTKRYSVIGALFYDDRGRIVGESSTSRFASGGTSLTLDVNENQMVAAILEAANNYSQRGSLVYASDQYDLSGDYQDDDIDEKELTDYTRIVENDESKDDPSADDTGENTEDAYEEEENDQDEQLESQTDERVSSDTYNTAVERIAGGTIFTDGNLYVVQISSWRNNSKAETEARKLKNKGHNAFTVQAYIPQKGGTWHRVRVGYFNSYDEARRYQRSIK